MGKRYSVRVYDQHLKEGVQYNSWRGMKASEVAQRASNGNIPQTSIAIHLTKPFVFHVPTIPIT